MFKNESCQAHISTEDTQRNDLIQSELYRLDYDTLKIDLCESKAWLKEYLACAECLWQTLNVCDKDQRYIHLKEVHDLKAHVERRRPALEETLQVCKEFVSQYSSGVVFLDIDLDLSDVQYVWDVLQHRLTELNWYFSIETDLDLAPPAFKDLPFRQQLSESQCTSCPSCDLEETVTMDTMDSNVIKPKAFDLVVDSFGLSPPKKRRIGKENTDVDSSPATSLASIPSIADEEADFVTNLNSTLITPVNGVISPQKVDELWNAIKSDYEYLMDDDAIEASCKSTESEVSESESDSFAEVSLTEFLKQYKELTDWLTNVRMQTDKKCQRRSSCCEKFVFEGYYDEMVKHSPRHKLLKDYARQLIKRYPAIKEQVNGKLAHLNSLWAQLEGTIGPPDVQQASLDAMIDALKQDVILLKKWLHKVENSLYECRLDPKWDKTEIQRQMALHQTLQKEIESQSSVIRAVDKLCNRLQPLLPPDEQGNFQDVVGSLEKRWHEVWLASLEWQFRLEDALSPTTRHPVFPIESLSRSASSGFSRDLTNSSDIIPFSEDEYEKIEGADSALGRSVSDHSLLTPGKFIQFKRENMRASSAPPGSEAPDIGYASDANNDEPPGAPQTFRMKKNPPGGIWRHSVTSAYGSDAQAESSDVEVTKKVEQLVKSSSHSYYTLTSLTNEIANNTGQEDASNVTESEEPHEIVQRLVSTADRLISPVSTESEDEFASNITRKTISEPAIDFLASNSGLFPRTVSFDSSPSKKTRKRKIKRPSAREEPASEAAWDSYQDPPYPTVTDDDDEEKLDDCTLTWDFPNNATEIGPVSPRRRSRSVAIHQDTDSDREDLKDVITESRKQLEVLERTLSADCIIGLNEVKATCKTNIECLDNVLVHMDTSDDLSEASDDVRLLVSRWKQLHNEAKQKLNISFLMKDVQQVHQVIQSTNDILAVTSFDTPEELEDNLKRIDTGIVEINSNLHQLDQLEQSYKESNSICGQIERELNSARTQLNVAAKQSWNALCSLQQQLHAWKRLQDGTQLLTSQLEEQQQILTNFGNSLKLRADCYSPSDMQSLHNEIQQLKQQIDRHDNYLQQLRLLVEETSTTRKSNFIVIDELDKQVSAMKHSVAVVDVVVQQKSTQAELPYKRSPLARFLRSSMPIPCIFILFLGVAYFIDPSLTNSLTSWTMTYEHIDGAAQ
ncbi:DgyrCDS11411 [Dimorphilus gyrociliatus]|uniref:DgyrCDS11411 n=1 Tax=Dimorphilus gyrociliatus TaxID=2664684 RepID=A0A7I8W546_9ANNE|nr:DgyrCDS11411 [Dimorphilus gyrociliatus]